MRLFPIAKPDMSPARWAQIFCFALAVILSAATVLSVGRATVVPGGTAATVPPVSVPQGRPAASPGERLHLVANPTMVRLIPPPGWIGDRPNEWISEHPVYKENCKTSQVIDEMFFLNRVIGNDEYLLRLSAEAQAKVPAATIDGLRDDIIAADGLAARLQALPPCPALASPPVTAVAAATPPTVAAGPRLGPAAPITAAARPIASPNAAPLKPVETTGPRTDSPQIVQVRFDDRMAALAPSGIRSFDEALQSIRRGKRVQLAIEGCAARAHDSAACVRRRLSLEDLLAKHGVRNPKLLLADLR